MEIKPYQSNYEDALFQLLEKEGIEWEEYYKIKKNEYKRLLEISPVYVAFDNNILCGYIRCHNDNGFGIYIYDLLVNKEYRGQSYGKMLIEHVCFEFFQSDIYVMSDADKYYEKQGYKKAGSIFIVQEGEG